MRKLLVFLPALSLFLLAGCGTDNNGSAQREEFRERIESQISEFNRQIEDARERSEELSGEAKNEMERAIDRLEEQKDQLAVDLEELRQTGDAQWEAAKDDIEESVAELNQAFNELRRNFSNAF